MSAAPSYIPINVEISNITRGATTSVSTTSDHYYAVGQTVRFHIPFSYGMQQINGLLADVLTIPTTASFTVNIDSRQFTAFISSPTYPGNTPPQVSAVGDVNNSSATTNSNGLTISGAFINNTNRNI